MNDDTSIGVRTLVGFVIFFLIAIAVVCLVVQWWIGRPPRSNELPPLVIPLAAESDHAVPAWHRAPPPPLPVQMQPPAPVAAPAPAPFTYQEPSYQEPVYQEPTPVRPITGQTSLKVVRDYAEPDEPAPSETVRFRRPSDEPVQLLPGRLEVISGDPRHQEIRFVRMPGRPAELILGRDPGDSAQHVTLRSNTVSRQHARFGFANGHWVVANLSQTNPVILNDEELSARDGVRDLADGDRLELGEVVLRYHAR